MAPPAARLRLPAKPALDATVKLLTTAAVQLKSINSSIIAENHQGGGKLICLRPDLAGCRLRPWQIR
jgi:hypothetical protein